MSFSIIKIIKYLFIFWCVIMGILVILTGSFHFVYNSAGSFKIEKFQTNPTLAVILVAVSLLVMGLITILYPFYTLFFKHESFKSALWLFTLWYFILACLTFFIAGIMGLVTGCLCFVTATFSLISWVIGSIPNSNESYQREKHETQEDTNTIIFKMKENIDDENDINIHSDHSSSQLITNENILNE